jgi:hypothetical protein
MTPFIRSNKVQQFFSSINNNWMILTRKNHFIIAIIILIVFWGMEGSVSSRTSNALDNINDIKAMSGWKNY